MFKTPTKDNYHNSRLLGAARIGESSFFVYKSGERVALASADCEKLHAKALKNMMKASTTVKRVLNKCRIRPFVNAKILKELTGGHMNDTCKIALGIYSNLSDDIKNTVNIDIIKEAAILHDLGKVLIPAKILNKPAKLTPKERKIMKIHSILGYELLKTQGIDEKILNLIKYHHQNLSESGYPVMVENHKPSSLGIQIISTADKYSALREKRIYRKRLSKLESLLILYREVLEGKIDKFVYDALFRYTQCCPD